MAIASLYTLWGISRYQRCRNQELDVKDEGLQIANDYYEETQIDCLSSDKKSSEITSTKEKEIEVI